MNSRQLSFFSGLASAILMAQPVRAQTPASKPADAGATYRFTGVVTDPSREPIVNAELVILTPGQSGKSTVTDSRGYFDFGQFTPGTLSFRVRRLGYEPRVMDVHVGAGNHDTSVEIALTIIPAELAKVFVSGAPGRLNEFFERRQTRAAFGRFLDQEEIRKKGARFASDLFRNVPGVSVKTNPAGGNAIRIRDCQPMVFIDGQRSPGAELDEVVSPGDIAAIEFYPSNAGGPAQYLERGNRLCGLILVWTKNQ
ncbi:MAG TPA: carboxypeptidase regulatory-like domain-containing protein [Gemmatimonadaceae bacterium]|nr:carboxypeptidase regulatory-like domain-containing protein [Gemmatimonadaceae bacterium]